MISVIVPTLNRASLLELALTSIQNQDLSPDCFEVLVIDNGSSDGTKKMTQKFEEKLNNLHYHLAAVPGLHEARHKGMNEAKFEILVFADDDIEATPTWLSGYYEIFQDPYVALAGGNNIPMYASEPPSWVTSMWNNSEKFGTKKIPQFSVIEKKGLIQEHDPHLVWGCNFAIRKSVLSKAGGFHPDGMPRDLIHFRGDGETHVSNYVQKEGLKCMFHPDASVFHKVSKDRMTFKYFYKRGFNQGISDSFSRLRKKVLSKNNSSWLLALKLFLYPIFIWSRALFSLNRAKISYGFGWARGYYFHQRLYKSDNELQKWLSKKDFL